MLLKSCDAPDGPLPWNHPCLAPAPLPASLLEHALGDAAGMQAEVPAAASWTLDWAVLGWLAFLLACVIILILIKERQAQKRITSRWVRRSIRLAARTGEFEEAFTDIHDKRCEEIFKQQERADALECGQTMLLDSSAVSSTFEEGLAERSYMTMAARMDLQLDESCAWMHWKQPRAIFAIRTWGGVVWRWLSTCVCEVISCGSCGLAGGSQMVSQIFAAVTSEGAKVVVLNSLAGGEKFWQEQGFQRFQPTMAWVRDCTQDVKKVLLSYRRKSAG